MTSDRCGSIAVPFPSVQRWQRKYIVGNYLTDALEIVVASNADAFVDPTLFAARSEVRSGKKQIAATVAESNFHSY